MRCSSGATLRGQPGQAETAAGGGAGRRPAGRRGRADESIARSAPCGAVAPLPRGGHASTVAGVPAATPGSRALHALERCAGRRSPRSRASVRAAQYPGLRIGRASSGRPPDQRWKVAGCSVSISWAGRRWLEAVGGWCSRAILTDAAHSAADGPAPRADRRRSQSPGLGAREIPRCMV
jgi:hypothetical protein